MSTDSDKGNSVVGSILGAIVVILVLYFLFLYGENIRILIYAVVFYLVIYLLIIRPFYKVNNLAYNLILILMCYLLFQIIYGSSPWLQLKEFEWTHSKWQRVNQVQLVDTQSEVYRRSKGVSYAYMDIIYQYEYQGKKYSTEQGDLARQYGMLLNDKPIQLRQFSELKLKNQYSSGQAVVLVNRDHPQESIYFYSQQGFDLRSSWLAKILYGLQLISVIVLIGLLGLLIKQAVNPNNRIQTWSKPKRYLFIATFFIIAWSVLFAGWILFMYIKNAP